MYCTSSSAHMRAKHKKKHKKQHVVYGSSQRVDTHEEITYVSVFLPFQVQDGCRAPTGAHNVLVYAKAWREDSVLRRSHLTSHLSVGGADKNTQL